MPARPHVLVDARFRPERRGGDRCRFELARHLVSAGGSGYSFLAYDDTAEALRQATGGCPVIATARRPWEHPGGDLFEHVRLPRLARQIGADLYHGTFNTLPVEVPRRRSPRLIVTVHDVAVYRMPEAYSRRFCLLSRGLIRAAVARADHIIAVSSATLADLVQLFPRAERKTSVILNGVGDEFLRAADLTDDQVAEAKRRLNLPPQYVLFVGNLERKKNLPRLLQAFARAKGSAGLPHRLVIVGQRPLGVPDAGLGAAIEDGSVVFTGFLPDADLPMVYRGADLVAYPSLYEGFGMPVLEGLAAGVPVLTSSVSSMPEVAGGAALLVDPRDVDQIAAGIVTALTDLNWRRVAVCKGRARARELTWQQNAQRTAGVYAEVHRPIAAR